MKKNTHPELHTIKATCGCGNVIDIVSTLSENQHLDICSACHPFYIGQQKLVDTGGRIDKFRSRFGASFIKQQ
ncbi:MAG: 50S ribosomal protein L31 [Gammaproteobacteria bacterium]